MVFLSQVGAEIMNRTTWRQEEARGEAGGRDNVPDINTVVAAAAAAGRANAAQDGGSGGTEVTTRRRPTTDD